MSNPQISVSEFVEVRQHLASLLSRDSQTQAPTRIRQAETLLMSGVIDVQAVLDELEPKTGTKSETAGEGIITSIDDE